MSNYQGVESSSIIVDVAEGPIGKSRFVITVANVIMS